MPPRADRAVAHVITGYDDQVRVVRARVESFVRRTWGGLDHIRDADVDRFVARVVPVVEGGQLRIAALTDSYLAALEQNVLGVPTRPRGVPARVVSTKTMRGVPAAVVYRRPAVTVYTALSKGTPFNVAMGSGLTRALNISATDLQLARTHAMRFVGSNNDRIIGYRRVPGGSNVCDLCDEATAEIYGSDQLMPIHGGCSCGVEAVFGNAEPGELSEPDTSGGAVVAVHEHGEIGPMLTNADETFTGPDDLDL